MGATPPLVRWPGARRFVADCAARRVRRRHGLRPRGRREDGLVPGIELTTIRVTVFRGSRQIDRLDRGAFVGDDFVEAQRVAEVRGIAGGSYRLQVELLDSAGGTVVERPVALTIEPTPSCWWC